VRQIGYLPERERIVAFPWQQLLSELAVMLSISTLPSWSAWFTISLPEAPQQQQETAVPANTNHSNTFAHLKR
jgi:hypothetical protein